MAAALDGIRIIQVGGGPSDLTAMMLSDMGAEVVKVEPPPGGRALGLGLPPSYVDRGKLSVVLNLKVPEGHDVFHRLVAWSDVVLEGFRPGVMDRLGVGFEAVRGTNPRIVYCALSGYGQDGPYASMPGHDANYLAVAGLLDLIGYADRLPVLPLNILADYAGASLHGVIGIMLALFARERTGIGQMVDVSYLDATLALLLATPNAIGYLEQGVDTFRGQGTFANLYPYYGVFEVADGGEITIAPMESHFWARFCDAIGRPDLKPYGFHLGDHLKPPTKEEAWARDQVTKTLKTKRREEWVEILRASDVPVGPVNTLAEALDDPQVRHRRMVVAAAPDPATGLPRKQAGVPIKLSGTPGEVKGSPPLLGEHTESVLKAIGYSAQEIAGLRNSGVT